MIGGRVSQILAWQANAAIAAGDPIAARAAAEEGRDLAEAIGDRFDSRNCRMCLGLAQIYHGDLAGAVAQFRAVTTEAKAAHDGLLEAGTLAHQGIALAWQGDTVAARAAADASLESGSEFGWALAGLGYQALAQQRPWPPATLRRRGTRPRRPGSTGASCPAMRRTCAPSTRWPHWRAEI
jgi:hypothetical protein